jgi:hypothetical protein
MSSIRYPSLDEFWPAIRARNFVKALGLTATNYAENMALLAKKAGVHPTQMSMVNPLTFAERNGINIVSLLGSREGFILDMERDQAWGSGKWAYALRQPIPQYADDRNKTTADIQVFFNKFNETTIRAERVVLFGQLFTYILGTEAFLRTYPNFYKMMVAKVAEVKAEPSVSSIMPIILKTEAFLAGLDPTATPPPLTLAHLPMHEQEDGEMAPRPAMTEAEELHVAMAGLLESGEVVATYDEELGEYTYSLPLSV